LLLEQLAHQPQRRPAVASALDQHVEDFALVVDGPPEVHPLERAHRVLEDHYEAVARPLAAALGIEMPRLRICPMQKRWGSHTRSGRVLLNEALITARRDCIDYVVVHELCHVVEPNHSPNFLRLLRRFMPDWERRKELLERSTV
jgi:predicted metal-dependent hydrolase